MNKFSQKSKDNTKAESVVGSKKRKIKIQMPKSLEVMMNQKMEQPNSKSIKK